LQATLLRRIQEDRFSPDLSGRLLGALVELPSYLDRSTDDLGTYPIACPEAVGGGVIAEARGLSARFTSPKEAWLLDEVAARRAAGEKVLVFLRHTGTGALPKRLLRLLRRVSENAVWLDTKKVPTAKREAWIDQHVLAAGADVLLVNPNAVRTGLNNLVTFSTAIWYELDDSATTYHQANGRLHRIGQQRPVTVLYPFYAGTAREVATEAVQLGLWG